MAKSRSSRIPPTWILVSILLLPIMLARCFAPLHSSTAACGSGKVVIAYQLSAPPIRAPIHKGLRSFHNHHRPSSHGRATTASSWRTGLFYQDEKGGILERDTLPHVPQLTWTWLFRSASSAADEWKNGTAMLLPPPKHPQCYSASPSNTPLGTANTNIATSCLTTSDDSSRNWFFDLGLLIPHPQNYCNYHYHWYTTHAMMQIMGRRGDSPHHKNKSETLSLATATSCSTTTTTSTTTSLQLQAGTGMLLLHGLKAVVLEHAFRVHLPMVLVSVATSSSSTPLLPQAVLESTNLPMVLATMTAAGVYGWYVAAFTPMALTVAAAAVGSEPRPYRAVASSDNNHDPPALSPASSVWIPMYPNHAFTASVIISHALLACALSVVYAMTGYQSIGVCIAFHVLVDMYTALSTWHGANNQLDWIQKQQRDVWTESSSKSSSYLATNGRVSPTRLDEAANCDKQSQPVFYCDANYSIKNEIASPKISSEIACPKISSEAERVTRRFFAAMDTEHLGSLSLSDVQRAVAYAFFQSSAPPTAQSVSFEFHCRAVNTESGGNGDGQKRLLFSGLVDILYTLRRLQVE